MPLVRYHIGNEYKLANPNLYTSAAKDDPQGLLEGVAIAGLVGIVRQLGDLAVFASEVFHDLHEEVLATATRGHDLRNRVQQLEAELPLIEKLILSHPNHVIFAYNPGVEWHANIQNDQSYLTHKDLPRFVQNYYEECKSPPRLSLLDKFDIAGAGACLKRYSDPSSFKIQWAHTEIRKAEKEQKDKKNRRIHKKIEQKDNDEVQNASSNLERMSYKVTEGDNTITSSNLHPLIVDSGVSKQDVASIMQVNHQTNPLREPIISKQEGFALETHSYGSRFERFGASVPGKDLQSNVPSFKSSQFVSTSSSFGSGRIEITDSVDYIGQVENKHPNVNMKKITEDDGASETDNFMDAMTTIESEIETDSEMRSMVRAHREVLSELRISKRTNVQSSEVNRLIPASEIEENSLEGSISESSERSNPRSSEFVFRPMMRSHNDIFDTDEDANGIHELPISSSSSSALSSPRPSTLATTVFNMHLRSGTEYHPSLGRSNSSSLRHSSRSSSPDINLASNRGSCKEDLDLDSLPSSHLQSPKRSGRFSSESSGSSSPDITLSSKRDSYKEELGSLRFPLNHGAFIKEMEDFPPPPPLPPLEWLMSRRVNGKSASSPTAMDPSLKISISTNVLTKTNQSTLEPKSSPMGLESIDNIPPTSDGHVEALSTRELSSNPQQSQAYAVALASHEISEVVDGETTEHTLERSPIMRTILSDKLLSDVTIIQTTSEDSNQVFSSSKMTTNETGSIDISNSKDGNFTSPSHEKYTSLSLPKNDIDSMRVIPQIPDATLLSTSEKDLAIEAIAKHGRNMLKKLPERSQSSRITTSDDRESMLEQIRTRSFNLRHAKTEKHDRLHSVVSNINVAAILEKANAIRQATGPNDDDYNDAWSDT